jgi:hypothetical protein
MNNLSIFATGTMRSGGSLFQNFMSVHSDVIIFSGFVNFFRFYDERYGKMDILVMKKILHHLKLRLKLRRNFDLPIDIIYENLKDNPNLSYADCYQEIMKFLRDQTNKKIWGEYVTMGWRKIPKYLEYFPNGKAIHIIRDPRAILTSFGKTSIMPEGYHLNSIFNWIDSYNHSKLFQKTLPEDRYKIIKFEDIHKNPKNEIKSICGFLDIKFQKNMIDSQKWESLFDKNFVSANTSGYTLKKVYGFDEKRATNWKNNIKEHELFICDILLDKFNNDEESFISNKTYSVNEIAKNLEIISKYPIFYNALQKYNLDKEGNDQHVLDPVKPENWDSDKSESGKFIDSEDYKIYINSFDQIMNLKS